MNRFNSILHRAYGVSVTALVIVGMLSSLSAVAAADDQPIADTRPTVEWEKPTLDTVAEQIRIEARDDLATHLVEEIRFTLNREILLATAEQADDSGV